LPSLKRIYLNAFPAVHIKPLDKYDYFLRFSSELLVLIFALGVTGLNLYHFYLADDFRDESYAAKFLSYHPDLNQKLYEKNSTITTKIVSSFGLVPLAQADDFEVLSANVVAPAEEFINEGESYAGDVLLQPQADTLSSLISKQIKVYETQAGDTLASIASNNGITVQTLMWANNLASQTIKPGWFLVVLPTDGILHKASSNDTLPDIRKKYGGNLETIIAYNGLENAEDIDAGQFIIVPGGKIPEAPKPKTVARDTSKVNAGNTVKPKVVNNGTGHIFPWGYCTWYVASKVHVPWGGNAKNWLANAKAYGAIVSSEPAAGAIVVTTDNARYGHVALVEKVEDGKIYITEMNYKAFGKVNTRTISVNSKIIRGYIYP
jgi:surface antigen